MNDNKIMRSDVFAMRCPETLKYELENIARSFVDLSVISGEDIDLFDNYAVVELLADSARATVCIDDKKITKEVLMSEDREYCASRALFKAMNEATGYLPEWGMLTGVRPAKMAAPYITSGMNKDETVKALTDKWLTSKQKAVLAVDVYREEEIILSKNKSDNCSIYISIPFCPTRCSYCSFISHDLKTSLKLIDPYVDHLCKEIEHIGKITKDLSLKVLTVYFGGGTPTSISAEQLSKICNAISSNVDLSHCIEYTVEAGRPDTIDEQKLKALKKAGVTRISINPQSFNDDVLINVGRNHTSKQVMECYELAKRIGFESINMDLIAGLPGDTTESFINSVRTAIELDPENITVHALTLKRSSRMVTGEGRQREHTGVCAEMIRSAYELLTEAKYIPYYMYRQKNTLDGSENIGYSKKGKECIYNIYIMDETHSILAAGAGAVTKLRNPNGNEIERIFNYKYPKEYIDGFKEMISRKDGISDFYRRYPI